MLPAWAGLRSSGAPQATLAPISESGVVVVDRRTGSGFDPRMTARQLATDWKLVDQATTAYWRSLKRRKGLVACYAVADDLRRQVLAMRPDWPSPIEREEDLAVHRRIRGALAAVKRRPR